MSAQIVSKATGAVIEVPQNAIDLDAPSIVRLDLDRSTVAAFERQGHDLVIRLTNGETIRVADFFPDNAAVPNDLVLRDEGGQLWLARVGGAAPRFSALRDLDELLAAESHGGGSSLLIPALLGGVAAAGGLVALASGGSDSRDESSAGQPPIPDPDTGTAPDREPPAAPTASVRADGATVTGRGEAGATVQVRDASGAVIGTAVVAADGSYTVALSPAQTNGEPLRVTQTDPAGNVSAATPVVAPDITPPVAPTATIDANGAIVRGTGEAGATVTVRDASGAVIGTAVVGADGSYAVTLSPAAANGGTLSVVQTDPAGNASPALSLAAPDITAPGAPTIAIDAAGVTATGTGEAGARVTITDAGGTTLATATVGADGRYTATLATPQLNGERLDAVQTDVAGNVSAPGSTTAPDLTAPLPPTAVVGGDGAAVTGTGEPGATITVRDAAGIVIGTAIVAADGSYAATLAPAQANGEALSVVQADAAGNTSPPLSLTAPDITAPPAPAALLDASGAVVTGTGEPGATVVVRDAGGATIGSATVNAQGSYTAVLTAPQADGQALGVTQADAAGNVSPTTPLAAPDLTAPPAPTAAVAADGSRIDGSGEAGATVTVRDPLGVVIGTATVAADGRYAVTLSPPQVDGETLDVRQADAAGNVSPPATAVAPDLTLDPAPDAPTAGVNADGTAVTGTAGPGALVTLYDAAGAVIATGTAAADGSYAVALAPPRIDGETIRVTQTDAAGAVSPPATAVAPDLTAPAAPTATVDANGVVVTGRGEPGATIVVRDADGTILATATANGRGDYAATLSPQQADGGTIAVTQADAAGNTSAPTLVAAPDITAPPAPVASVGADGGSVTGTGEPGATVTVRDAAGTPIGSATVAADGSYAVGLSPARANGETITVIQTDAAGNASPATSATAPDITAPALPVATVAADGTGVAGTGEPGARVTVTDAAGTPIGSAVVDADGRFTAPLATPQANGETVRIVLTDAAGNVSPTLTLVAPDITAPAAPTAVIAGDGTGIAGTGEPGATVAIRDAAGTAIATATVAADGSFSATLTPPQANGGTLSVVQTDAAGNASPALSLAVPDITAPAAPVAAVSADGAAVTGTGEAGTIATVRDAAGTLLGAATVGADGSFAVPLAPPQANGGAVTVTLTDAAGNASPAVSLAAPDITAPAAPVATLDATGAIVTGTGEPGARVTVTGPGGTPLGSATVTAQGAYSVVLATPQVDSQALAVTQADAAGNVSPATGLVAPDLTAPAAPLASVGADGTSVAGTGEPGATVTVRDPLGVVIGTAQVAADGSYTVALTPAQTDGEQLTVRQADAAGNVSPPTAASAPDMEAGRDPDAPTAAVATDGSAVTGTAMAGAAITVYDADGNAVATGTAAADGSYSVALTPPRIDGETVRVTQTDGDGATSPPATAIAPDLTAPPAPTASLDATGSIVTGTGEPGASVTVRAADGTPLGTATVTANGAYAVTLAAAQTNGETLSVTQADAAGNVSPPTPLAAPDFVAPAAPLAAVSADGTAVTGAGEPGTTATVRDAAGAAIGTATVAADGSFTVPLAPAQANGEAVSVTLTDGVGNVSPATPLTAPDITAPAAPVATIAGDGTSIAGTGEAGATVTVRDAAGAVIGSATVAADGSFTVPLAPAQVDGQALTATQSDRAGNTSPPATALAPDLTAPAAPTATIAADGASVSGTGEAGARVVLTDATGAVIGVATVAADGSYVAALDPAQVDGETLRATQTDGGGNVSPQVAAIAPDLTAPAAPTLAIADDGASASGTGEPGATVTLRNPDGSVIATAPVAADGSYTIALAPPRLDGETLSATQADAAGNVSAPAAGTAPDTTAPPAPVAAIDAAGATVTGTGEPGATVTVSGPAGPLGTAVVAADGSFAVPLAIPQANGEALAVVQTDPAGNASPATPLAAPDVTAPAAPTAAVAADGATVSGQGEAGATVTITAPGGAAIGSAVVAADGRYTVTLDAPRTNGELLGASQRDGAGNASGSTPALAPDTTPPTAPAATVSADGGFVLGTGEPGARVTVTGPAGALGTAVVAADGRYAVPLAAPQTDGQALTVVQADAAGNVSAPANAVAPDLTAPPPPSALVVSGDGTTLTGAGEAGARVEVRGPGNALIGSGTVAPDGSFTLPLAPAQASGGTLVVTQADAAGNVSGPASIAAPFDIAAFDNADTVTIDLVPNATPVNYGTANYVALVSLGALNLQAEVLAVPAIRFEVAAGHSLDAVFTYDALLDLGVASGYAVVVQRFDGTQWVAVSGTGPASLLDIGLLGGNLSATGTLGPGDYRAFLTFQGTAGVGLLGSLTVAGVDSDFTDIAAATPGTATGNVITDAGPAGEVDVTGPGTRVASVTVGGVTTAVAAGGTVIDGAWGTLTINPDGSYSYTPDASATAIGRTDSFTYTLLDPTDGETESATLSIAVGSPDITGAPVAVADQAVAAVTYANVETSVPVTPAFSFGSQPTGVLQSTGAGSGSFTVAPDATADLTITAVRQAGLSLSLLPSYTLTVRDAGGATVFTETRASLAGLPIGTGVSFTLDDLPSGTYSYTVSSRATLGTFGTTVSLGSTTTFLDAYTLATRETAEGNLFANDTAHTPFAILRVDTGGGFAEVGDTPVTLAGRYGTLTLDEAGGYVYQPSATLGYATSDLTDSFTYQIAQPNGSFATATLTVTIDVPADGPAAAPLMTSAVASAEPDVVPLDAFLVHGGDAAASVPATTVTGLATYDLFEGKGDLEDVLSHYLAARQPDGDGAPPPPLHPETMIDTPMPAVVDPLDYLVALPDQDHIGNNVNHGV